MGNTTILVGAGLLAKKECQSTLSCLTHRFREQARSHKDYSGQQKRGFLPLEH